MRRFLGSKRSLLLTAAIAASAISLVSLAASGAIASGRQQSTPASSRSTRDDIPTLQQKLADCRRDVALDREAIDYAEKLLAFAKRNQVVVISAGNTGPLILTFAAVRDSYILSYVTGRITKAQLARGLSSLALTAAKTLKVLKGLIEQARDERDADQNRCAKLAQELRDAQSGGGGGGSSGGVTLTLQPVKAGDVENTHQGELTINAAGKSAHFDNSKSGGAHWQIDYSWDVPQTITAGKSYQLMLHDTITGVQPSQPLGDQMNALAPGFAQAIQAHWPDSPDASKQFTVPVSAGTSGSSDYTIRIGFISSTVTYHYAK